MAVVTMDSAIGFSNYNPVQISSSSLENFSKDGVSRIKISLIA